MAAIASALDGEVEELTERVRRSLVRIQKGHGGAGAGAIWHPDGLILTNAHVIGRRSRVVVADGVEREAKGLAVDTKRDLAALSGGGSGLAGGRRRGVGWRPARAPGGGPGDGCGQLAPKAGRFGWGARRRRGPARGDQHDD